MMVITGICRLDSTHIEEALGNLSGIKQMRLVHPLERLAIAAVGGALFDAGIDSPIGDAGAGMYIGIDDAIEDLKDEYFGGILTDGILGASPLLFPFTSANAIAAQISIAFDLRCESIMVPVNGSCSDVIEYATECIAGNYVRFSIAGCITMKDHNLPAEQGRYAAEFFIIERKCDAENRKAKICCPVKADNS